MISVAATFTAEPLLRPLQFWLDALGWTEEVAFAPYGQLLQQLFDPGSLLRAGGSTGRVVLIRPEDWLREARGLDSARRREIAWATCHDVAGALMEAAADGAAPLLVVIGPPSADRDGRIDWLELERRLRRELTGGPGLFLLTDHELLRMYPCDRICDPQADRLGHVPYSEELFAAMGTAIARRLLALKASPCKAIVLDCDNTLWRGILAEDGPDGVVIDGPRRRLQESAKSLKDKGFLLCLCSKNDERLVWDFIDHGGKMVLRRPDIAAWRINWEPKSENLRALARELNVGLDSLVFIDDDSMQCAEARARCPQVTTVQLPDDDDDFAALLDHLWPLDRLTAPTGEDRRRTELYHQQREREALRQGSVTLADFLAGLELQVDVAPIDTASLPRVAQLVQRTNQFNLTTIRRSEADLRRLLEIGELDGLQVCVADRFGDYGLVGTVLYSVRAGCLAVDTFLLSCRVLGRGVEHRVMARLGELAPEQVSLVYRPTPRNAPARQFLDACLAAYGTPDEKNGSVRYRAPAEVAAAIRVNEAGASVPAAPSPTGRGPKTNEAAPSELFGAIARLRTGRQLLEWMSGPTAQRPAAGEYRGGVEAAIAEVLSDLLEIESVPRDANFYELGGDSLKGIQALAAIHRRLDVELPIDVLFAETCCVASLAEEVRVQRSGIAAGAPR